MVPDVSHQAWRDLIVGKKQIASSHFGFNLLLTTSRLFYQSDPSQGHLAVLAEQLHTYMEKYEGMYQEELQHIFGADYTVLFAH
jgi:hypothetical protein